MYPFVEQVVSILFPGWYDLLTLWRTNLFVKFDCLFTTEDLSGMLKTASLKTIDICIGVQDHCQLSVCIRHVHCLKLDKHTMSLDNEDLASLQTGHTRAIKECLYGVSAGYLGNLPENMVEPFARTSGEWQAFHAYTRRVNWNQTEGIYSQRSMEILPGTCQNPGLLLLYLLSRYNNWRQNNTLQSYHAITTTILGWSVWA